MKKIRESQPAYILNTKSKGLKSTSFGRQCCYSNEVQTWQCLCREFLIFFRSALLRAFNEMGGYLAVRF